MRKSCHSLAKSILLKGKKMHFNKGIRDYTIEIVESEFFLNSWEEIKPKEKEYCEKACCFLA